MKELNLGAVIKVKWLEKENLTKANHLMIIGKYEDEVEQYYITVLHPYGIVTEELIKVYPYDIIEIVNNGFDAASKSKEIARLKWQA